MSVSLNGTNGLTFADSTTQNTGGYTGFRNRIINGDMRIDQRNAGASVTPTSGFQYTLDRWQAVCEELNKYSVQQNAGGVTPPTGYTNYLGITSLSAYSSGSTNYFFIQQIIEGLNCADLAWGTASASSVTLAFAVRSSLTGTFGGSLRNSASNRSYPFSFTVNSANTWETKTITIAGDTTGTWLTTNGVGISVSFNLGGGSSRLTTGGAWAAGNFDGPTGATSVVGTSGATFYITGVQLEKGSVATPFEFRPYGMELSLCQRYYIRFSGDGTGGSGMATGFQVSTTASVFNLTFPVQMRSEPTATAASLISSDQDSYDANATLWSINPSQLSSNVVVTHAAVGAKYRPATLSIQNNTTGFLAFNSEL